MGKDVVVKCSAQVAETDRMAEQKARMAEIRARRAQKMEADGVREEDLPAAESLHSGGTERGEESARTQERKAKASEPKTGEATA